MDIRVPSKGSTARGEFLSNSCQAFLTLAMRPSCGRPPSGAGTSASGLWPPSRRCNPGRAARTSCPCSPEADDHRLPMVVPAHVHLCIVVPVQLDGELVIRKSYCMNDESSLASWCRLARCLLRARSFTKQLCAKPSGNAEMYASPSGRTSRHPQVQLVALLAVVELEYNSLVTHVYYKYT